MRTFILVVSLVSIVLNGQIVRAQEDQSSLKNVGFKMGSGLELMRSSNRHLSTTNAAGALLPFQFAFEHRTSKHFMEAGLNIKTGKLESAFEFFAPNYTEVTIGFTYMHHIWSRNKYRLFVGGTVNYNIWFMRYRYVDAFDVVSMAPAQNLMVTGLLEKELSPKSRISWNCQFNVLSRIYLQPFGSYDHDYINHLGDGSFLFEGVFKSFPTVFTFNNRFDYRRTLGKRWDAILSLTTNRNKINGIKSAAFHAMGVGAAIKFKFK